ncbi:MAG: T9SS type A sorting domain-containing protein [bacterium]
MNKGILLFVPLLLFAQNYVLKKDVLSSGGRKMTSTDYILQGTISQTAIGRVTDTDYQGVIGFWHPSEAFPPIAPYINPAEKSGSDVELTWNMITTDTLGNPETVHYYVVYRSTSPSFIPGSSDSVGVTIQPDTVFTDVGALSSGNSYYYLVKAVDVARNRSVKSNMGYKLNKFFNENASSSDRNWISLPWHSNYTVASDLTDDLSSSGVPLIKIVNLRDDQLYENWLWDPDFFEWYGDDFSIVSGRGYEMETTIDTSLFLVGANNPNGLVSLNENAATTDRNWISIPYNAAYSAVSDITTDYSPSGVPLIKIVNLRDDQLYENWLWDPDFLEWYGDDFNIAAGRGYEFEITNDTIWNPTEYSNKAGDVILALTKRFHQSSKIQIGRFAEADREPIWKIKSPERIKKEKLVDELVFMDAKHYEPSRGEKQIKKDFREAGVPHVVRCHLDFDGFNNLVFTAYRVNKPKDVLTEKIIGCGFAINKNRGAIWFNTGNFRSPWLPNEKIILIIEAILDNKGYFSVTSFELDEKVDIQELGDIVLAQIPEPKQQSRLKSVIWDDVEDPNIIGFSIYKSNKRLNEKVIAGKTYVADCKCYLKPVFLGGYETVYTSYQESATIEDQLTSVYFAFDIWPNPFKTQTQIDYALPYLQKVTIKVYDISGRKVKTIITKKQKSGYYSELWRGDDDKGRKVAAGVYFVRITTKENEKQAKIILVH